MTSKSFKKIDIIETVESIITFVLETDEDIKVSEMIGRVVMVDDQPYSCIGIERFDLETTPESTIWAGEKFKMFGVYQPFIEEEGDDWW